MPLSGHTKDYSVSRSQLRQRSNGIFLQGELYGMRADILVKKLFSSFLLTQRVNYVSWLVA